MAHKYFYESTPRQSGKSWAYYRMKAALENSNLGLPSSKALREDLRWRPVIVSMAYDWGRDPVQAEIDRLDAAEREALKGKPI